MNLELEKYTKLKPDMKDYEHNLERLKSYDMIGWMEIDEKKTFFLTSFLKPVIDRENIVCKHI